MRFAAAPVRLVADRGLRTQQRGSVLLGGHPFRVLTLRRSGADTVRSWFRGVPVGPSDPPPEQQLAARLLDAGIAHPEPDPSTQPCHVVIPFFGDGRDLERTLADVRAQGPASITVVDDGNQPPVRADTDVTVLRHDEQQGPGIARNTGWRHVLEGHPDATVAFVDAGVTLTDGALARLCGHLDDRATVAAAPRIRSTPGPSILARYERHYSPLDLGPDASPVGPHRRITYVPTACLVVRGSALARLGGFDPALRFGEDVDLVWRLGRDATIRYDPAVSATHRPRATLAAFVAQRMHYASAAAPLASRHGISSRPWRGSPLAVAGIAMASAGHPLLGFALGYVLEPRISRQLDTTATPHATAFRLVSLGQVWAFRSFAESVSRTWVVPAAVLAVASPWATPVRRWMLAGCARRLADTRDPVLLAVGVLDDVAYGVGVVLGAWKERSLRALTPLVTKTVSDSA